MGELLGDFQRCPLCKDHGWFNGRIDQHRCKPAWECRLEQHDDEWWDTVHAADAESAVERFAEQYDCDGGEYAIVSGRMRGDCIVLVRRKVDSDDKPETERWAVEGEAVPQYSATKIELAATTADAQTEGERPLP